MRPPLPGSASSSDALVGSVAGEQLGLAPYNSTAGVSIVYGVDTSTALANGNGIAVLGNDTESWMNGGYDTVGFLTDTGSYSSGLSALHEPNNVGNMMFFNDETSTNSVISFTNATGIFQIGDGAGHPGNVGIGTTAPSSTLHVVGSARVSATTTLDQIPAWSLVATDGSHNLVASTTAFIATSTYNASMTIATAAPLGGGGKLTNNGTLSLTCTGCLTGTKVDSINSITGAVVVAGTANQIAISSSSQTITASLPSTVNATNLNLSGTLGVSSTLNVAGVSTLATTTISTNLQTQTLNEPIATSSATTASTAINWSASSIWLTQLNIATTSITFNGCSNGQKPTLWLQQNATGSETVSWPSSGACQVSWASSTAPTLTTTANRLDAFSFQCFAPFGTSTIICHGQYGQGNFAQ